METTTKRYVPTHPCAKCPFLATFKDDKDYLHRNRRPGIMRSVHAGGDFPCHETTVYDTDSDDMIPTSESKTCAGLTLVMLRAGYDPPGPLKYMERLGAFDAEAFVEANEHVETWSHDEACGLEDEPDEEFEPCNTVGPYCIAPAGYMEGDAVVRGTESADCICPCCGEPVCSECADDETGHCGTCAEYEDD